MNVLADVLRSNTDLEVLSLGSNNLAAVVLNALKDMFNLRSLYLSDNNVSGKLLMICH